MTASNTIWLSVYLYYEGDADQFIINYLHPFISTAKKNKWISTYFFIRYAEKGSHIRLRLKASNKNIEMILKDELLDYFNKNHLEFNAYTSEIDRYGGKKAMSVAEDQFYLSSETVLSRMTQTPTWSYVQAFANAIQLHATMLATIEPNHTIADQMLTCMIRHHLKQKTTEMLETYRQNKGISPSMLPVLFNDPSSVVTQWKKAMISINNQLLNACNQKDFVITDCLFMHNYSSSVDIKTLSYWHILDSYIHMTNNRLGIQNKDEPFILYLIQENLKKL